jgi:cytochrome d ubiquinol oxidase subunit I
MEGDWNTETDGDPLVLFALPNMQGQRNDDEIAIPRLGSLILTHTWSGGIRGLKTFPPGDLPYVPIVFWAFRVMVALGMLMALVGFSSLALRRGGRIFTNRPLHWVAVAMAPSGFIALLAGWTVTETGRQPFTVYGLMRTADSASPIGAPGLVASLAAFAVVYFIVFGAGILYILRLMARPPVQGETGPAELPARAAGITPGPAIGDTAAE